MAKPLFASLLALCAIATACADIGFKFNESKLPFAEFRPWDLSVNGAIDLYFQTKKQNALLIYQDDGEGGDWIDVFLVNGQARLRMRMGTCDRAITHLKGNFTDAKWHRLNVERNSSMTTISIDGIRSEFLLCEETYESPVKPKPSKSSLYLGGIPLLSKSKPIGHWANPTIFREAQNHRFTGCIARVRYSNGDKKLRKAKYKSSSGTTANCHGACIGKNSKACKNGGKCLDLLVSMRCDCRGTGFTGMYCQEKLPIVVPFTNATSTTLLNTTLMVSAHARGKASAVEAPAFIAGVMSCLTYFILNNAYDE